MPTKSELLRGVAVLFNQLADLEDGGVITPPVVDPEPETPTPVPVPTDPIWALTTPPTMSVPAEVVVPPGTRDIYIPVMVSNTDRQSCRAVINRLVNLSDGGINVGDSAKQRADFAGLDVVYHWSPGDDLMHWLRLSPRSEYPAGRGFTAAIVVAGLNDSANGPVDGRNGTRNVRVRFVEGAPAQEVTQPFHRPLRRLDLSHAQRRNQFDPANLRHNPTGANGDWMSALSHGRSQDGNGETGLYSDSSIAGAVNPISYDATERAIRLHSRGFDAPVRWDGRDWNYQAAVLQGLHRDDVCGAEGVWRMEAKIPLRRYSWPAFWLVSRMQNSRGEWYSSWPQEVDILEKFNHAWGAADTPFTSSFAQHFGPQNRWDQKVGAFGTVFDVHEYGSPRTPLDEVYTSWACHIKYDEHDTTKSEVTFFVNDMEVGCAILHARHQDLNRKEQFYPIFNVAVKTPSGYTPARFNNDDGRGKTGDMFVRDVAYYPTGARMV